jgi:hypothetical protein
VAINPGPFEIPEQGATIMTHCISGTKDIVRLDLETGIATRFPISPFVFRGTNWIGLGQHVVLFWGGYDAKAGFLANCWAIDFSKAKILPKVGMNRGRYFHAIINTGPKIFVFGGSDSQVLKNCEKYELVGDNWTPIADLPVPMTAASATAYRGRVYIVSSNQSVLVEFDPET